MAAALIYRKKLVVSKIENLSGTEHGEILKILESSTIPFSRNKNGCFVDMNQVDQQTLENIEKFVDYCNDNKKRIDEYNKQLNECKLRGTLQGKSTQDDEDDFIVAKQEFDDESDIILDDPSDIDDEIDAGLDVVAQEILVCDTEPAPIVSDLARKKLSSRFVIAKKRFAKRSTAEQRIDFDASEILM